MKFNAILRFILISILIGMGLLAYTFFIEPGLLRANEQKFQDWPAADLRVAFFADLHMGSPHIDADYVENLVGKINAYKPDIILIGGDLTINEVVGGTKIPFTEVSRLLKKLNAPLGKFAVLGNHDWWNDTEEIHNGLKEADIEVLENDSKLITHKETNFELIGIGDHSTKHSDLEKSFSKSQSKNPKLIFMHDPASLLELKKNFNLAFAGHMHGGQVYIPGIGAPVTPGKAPKTWARGWIDLPIGKLFVSTGIGTSILPVRFNALPEFVIFDLKN